MYLSQLSDSDLLHARIDRWHLVSAPQSLGRLIGEGSDRSYRMTCITRRVKRESLCFHRYIISSPP